MTGRAREQPAPRGDHRARRPGDRTGARHRGPTATPAATRWATSRGRSAGSRSPTWSARAGQLRAGRRAWHPVPAPWRRTASASRSSAGKDSTTGHWELCGLMLPKPFPTYPQGFPGRRHRGVLAADRTRGAGQPCRRRAPRSSTSSARSTSAPASGSSTPRPTASSRSPRMRRRCRSPSCMPAAAGARRCSRDRTAVSRVIARPFTGQPGAWARTPRRKDFSLPPPGPTLLDGLAARGIPRVGVGKVDDLFAGRGITSVHTATNADAYRLIDERADAADASRLAASPT